jgi:hypothetical protein
MKILILFFYILFLSCSKTPDEIKEYNECVKECELSQNKSLELFKMSKAMIKAIGKENYCAKVCNQNLVVD